MTMKIMGCVGLKHSLCSLVDVPERRMKVIPSRPTHSFGFPRCRPVYLLARGQQDMPGLVGRV